MRTRGTASSRDALRASATCAAPSAAPSTLHTTGRAGAISARCAGAARPARFVAAARGVAGIVERSWRFLSGERHGGAAAERVDERDAGLAQAVRIPRGQYDVVRLV